MNILEIPLKQIAVIDRAREDYGDVRDLAETIKEHGLLQPITVMPYSGGEESYRLLAGGRRYYAHAEAGLDTIQAIVREFSSDVDMFEVELIENIQRKDLTWQERAKLEKKIYDLKGTTRATGEAMGHSAMQVSRNVRLADALEAFPELASMKSAKDAHKALAKMEEGVILKELERRAREKAAEQSELIVSGGEEIELPPELKAFTWADRAFIVGDALMGLNDLYSGEDAAKFQFAEIDPPYGIDLGEIKRRGDVSLIDFYTEIAKGGYPEFLGTLFHSVWVHLDQDAFAIVWFGITHYELVRESLRRVGFSVNDVPCIWYKGNQGQTNQPDYNLANCYETFLVARRGKAVVRRPGRSNVFHFAPLAADKKIHATEKPLELMEEIVSTFAYPGTRAVVPFLGSGVTLRALNKGGIQGVGWDLSGEVKTRFMMKVQEDAQ